MLFLWASRGKSPHSRAILAAACFLPGLLVAAVLAGPVLLQWKQAELVYGAASLKDTFKSLYDASFYELSPALRDLVFIDVPRVIVPLFGIFAVWRTTLLLIHWRSLRNEMSRWRMVFTAVPVLAVAVALALHWAVFRLMRIPLPQDRTAIYIVVLSTLFLGALAALPIPTRAGEMSSRGLTILMVILGSYFLLCLRVNYFKEWKWDSDTDKIYSVLASYNHACGLKDIAVNWQLQASLNFYRDASGRETIPKFLRFEEYPAGKRAYVVYQPEEQDFLTRHGLNVVYQTPSGAAIALDPKVAPPPGESACPLKPPDQIQ
jgi:hypothetical protein